jgi:hypothetical protein
MTMQPHTIYESGKLLFWYEGKYRTVTNICTLPSTPIRYSNLKRRLNTIEDKEGLDISTLLYDGREANQYLFGDTTITMPAMAELTGVPYKTVYIWVATQGLSMEEVVHRAQGGEGFWSHKELRMKGKPFDIPDSLFDSDFWMANVITSLEALGYRGEQLELEALKRIK